MSRFSIHRPWQIQQWHGLDTNGKPKPFNVPIQLQTRQRKRQAFRLLAHKQITEQYGPEPRHARRGIAQVLARRAYREHMEAA